jgi:hypothetical protein
VKMQGPSGMRLGRPYPRYDIGREILVPRSDTWDADREYTPFLPQLQGDGLRSQEISDLVVCAQRSVKVGVFAFLYP